MSSSKNARIRRRSVSRLGMSLSSEVVQAAPELRGSSIERSWTETGRLLGSSDVYLDEEIYRRNSVFLISPSAYLRVDQKNCTDEICPNALGMQ